MLAAEPRVCDPAALAVTRHRIEPVPVRTAGVVARLHQSDRGGLCQPRPLGRLLSEGYYPALNFGIADLLPGLMAFFPQPQRIVEHHPRAAKRSCKSLLLPRHGAQTVAIPDQHSIRAC